MGLRGKSDPGEEGEVRKEGGGGGDWGEWELERCFVFVAAFLKHRKKTKIASQGNNKKGE